MSYIQKQGKNTAWKNSLMRNLASEFIIHERLEITLERALELQPVIDKLMILGKTNDLASRRAVLAYLRPMYDTTGLSSVDKLFNVLAPKYNNCVSGFTKIYKTTKRRGDSVQMVIIKFV